MLVAAVTKSMAKESSLSKVIEPICSLRFSLIFSIVDTSKATHFSMGSEARDSSDVSQS